MYCSLVAGTYDGLYAGSRESVSRVIARVMGLLAHIRYLVIAHIDHVY